MTSQESLEQYGRKQFQAPEQFQLDSGDELPGLTLTYDTYGVLNKNASNVVVIHHALSAHSQLIAHDNRVGWWEQMVGEDKPINTKDFFIICINNLGSCVGSTGPLSINPSTQKPYQASFPNVTIGDMVRSQTLLLKALGIEQIHAVIGNSMGGMLSLEMLMAGDIPVKKAILSTCCHRAYPSNIANRLLQKSMITLDPNWQEGFYVKPPNNGFRLARILGNYSYRHPSNIDEKFADRQYPEICQQIKRYYEYNANKFIEHFDANAYIRLLDAMDSFDISDNKDRFNTLLQMGCQISIIGVDSDVLYPINQQKELHQLLLDAGVKSELLIHHSPNGHDAFLTDTETFGRYFTERL